MKNNRLIKAMGLLCTVVFVSCAGSNSSTNSDSKISSSQIVGEVAGDPVTYSELLDRFQSGNPSDTVGLNDLQNFLPIYLNYRSKLKSAEDAGYFNSPQILSEFDNYAKQAAYAYWIDQEIRPKSLDRFKSRYNRLLKSSHVLISVPQNAGPKDTLAAYNSLIEARDKFLSGEATMAELNEEYSSVREGRKMGGTLPWFSVGTTVREFEDELYGLEVGELSMPFRTQFGYHIVLLEDEKPRQPSRYVSHVYISPRSAISKADSAYQKLERGAPWSEVVREYTDDRSTANNSGRIGWVNYGDRYDGDFIDTLMSIDPALPYTEPKRTYYGTQIFRIDSVRTFQSEEEENAYIMEQLENSSFFKNDNSFVLSWVRDEFGDKTYSDQVDRIDHYLESLGAVELSTISVPDSLSDIPVFSVADYTFDGGDLIDHLKSTRGTSKANQYRLAWLNSFIESMVDSVLTPLTLERFPEFSEQLDGYKKGLVVYQVNEDSVWNSATIDSTILYGIYNSDPETYSFDKRYYYYLISTREDSTLENVIEFVNEGNSLDSLRSNGFPVSVGSDSSQIFQGEPFDKLINLEEGSFSSIFSYNNRKALFYLVKILPPRRMRFDEAFERIASDYQPKREELWIQRLRTEYEVKEYPENLEKNYRSE